MSTIYALIMDYGLNGNELVSVHAEEQDTQAAYRAWREAFERTSLMTPYENGMRQWAIDTETLEVREIE